jgi:hypothetical protein
MLRHIAENISNISNNFNLRAVCNICYSWRILLHDKTLNAGCNQPKSNDPICLSLKWKLSRLQCVYLRLLKTATFQGSKLELQWLAQLIVITAYTCRVLTNNCNYMQCMP